jgi:hypothetical protein
MTQSLASYNGIPEAKPLGELSDKGLFGLVVPEATTNLFPDPSFEATASLADWNNVSNCTITQPTTLQVKGLRSILVTPTGALSTVAVYNGFHPSTSGMAASTLHTFSWYQKGAGGDTFSVVVVISGTSVGSKTYTLTGDLDRITISFTSPASINTSASFTFTQTKASGKPYYFDCFQMEPKGYATQYVDGDQFNGSWVGTQQASPSTRAANAPYGRALNLKDYFGYRVTGGQNLGMPDLENASTPYGLLGGEYYQRTTPNAQVRTLVGTLESRGGLTEQQRLRQRLINFLASDNVRQQAAPLYLQFQALDGCGNPVGKLLEMACTYVSGMAGNLDNFYLDNIPLQFKEYVPPSIKEFSDVASTVTAAAAVTNTGVVAAVRDPDTGLWTGLSTSAPTNYYTLAWGNKDNQVWYGGGEGTGAAGFVGQINPITNVVTTLGAINKRVYALLGSNTGAGQVYAGGEFTTPFTYIMLWNGGAWVTVSSGSFNAEVRGLCYDSSGNVIAVGAFTAPASRVAKWNGSAWSAVSATAITGGGAIVYCCALGKDNNLYIGGDFTSPTTNIAKYNGTAYVALGTGGPSGGAVRSIAVAPDGSLIVGGQFNLINGATSNGIARWNGVSWQDLAAPIQGMSVSVNQTTGEIFASAQNTLYHYNGSTWVVVDLSFVLTSGGPQPIYIFNAPNGKLYVGFYYINVGANTYYIPTAGLTVNYQGTAPAYPVITFTATASTDTLYQISNNTTKANIYLNAYTMLSGEVLTLNLDPRNFSFKSSYRGDILNQILSGSNLAQFALMPGNNYLTLFATNPNSAPVISMQVRYQNTHWGFEAGVGT